MIPRKRCQHDGCLSLAKPRSKHCLYHHKAYKAAADARAKEFETEKNAERRKIRLSRAIMLCRRNGYDVTESAGNGTNTPWSGCTVSFPITRSAAWNKRPSRKLPKGWELVETGATIDNTGGVVTFRVSVLPSYKDGMRMAKILKPFQKEINTDTPA